MGITKWYEVSCDKCGCAEHFPIGLDWKKQARETGWIVSKHGVFCTEKCLSDFKILNEAKTGCRNDYKIWGY